MVWAEKVGRTCSAESASICAANISWKVITEQLNPLAVPWGSDSALQSVPQHSVPSLHSKEMGNENELGKRFKVYNSQNIVVINKPSAN
jgi:hypothetical protein